jgi:hypothetical protein
MSDTTIELLSPRIDGNRVIFEWSVAPPTDLYHSTSFTLSFPESVDPALVPERVWWTVFMLCLHSHWVLLRPCTVRIPFAMPDNEVEVWSRLLDSYVATAERQRNGEDFTRTIHIETAGEPLGEVTPLAAGGRVAAAFSGGKDSLVQAALLMELGQDPVLVATTSAIPGLVDHGTSHRRRAFDEIQRRRGVTLVEVTSDYRSSWDNGAASRRGYPFGVNEISDTLLYTAVLVAVGYAFGATRLFLASENEVSQNQVWSGRFLQHSHFMYSATTLAAVSAVLAPLGMSCGSLTSALHSSQVQELLTTRYQGLRDLQFSCWRTTEERRACSECSECKRLAWIAMSLGRSPADMGVDVLHLLENYDDPARASRQHTYHPNAVVSARMRGQTATALVRISGKRVLWNIARSHPAALFGSRAWRAVATFKEIRQRAAAQDLPPGSLGYRAGYLENIAPDLRVGLTTIFDAHFDREPEDGYASQLDQQRAAIAHITAPMSGEEPGWNRPGK